MRTVFSFKYFDYNYHISYIEHLKREDKPTEECKSLECKGGGFISCVSINRQSEVTTRKPVDISSEKISNQ